MSTRLPLSVVIITLNEEHNIARCIKSVSWAEEILVLDSNSTDRTQEIAKNLGARVVPQAWLGYGQQKNAASGLVRNNWILYLDADEVCTDDLRNEIAQFVSENGKLNGVQYWIASMPRKTWFLGRWIMHGGWYPNVLTRLGHRFHTRWTEPAVHECLEAQGGTCFPLKAEILHYTFRDVGDQVTTNVKYARYGAMVARERGEIGSLAKIFSKPVGKFIETYVWKLGFLDGLPGLVISINAAHSIFMKYVELRFEKNTSSR